MPLKTLKGPNKIDVDLFFSLASPFRYDLPVVSLITTVGCISSVSAVNLEHVTHITK